MVADVTLEEKQAGWTSRMQEGDDKTATISALKPNVRGAPDTIDANKSKPSECTYVE